VFLLVENYNYIDAFVGFGRRGIFEWGDPQQVLHFSLSLYVCGREGEEELDALLQMEISALLLAATLRRCACL
jgi:hypothetical protein